MKVLHRAVVATVLATAVVITPTIPVSAAEVTCTAPDYAAVLTPPGDLRAGRSESDVCFSTYVERSNVTLTTALQVDELVGDPGVWLGVGSVVTSTIFHVDKIGSSAASVSMTRQFTMPEPVIAIIRTQARLVGSDTRLGVAGSRYPTGPRGLEAGDSIVVEPDGHTVTFTMSSASDVDQIRVITGTPATRLATTTALTLSTSSVKLGASVTMRAVVSRTDPGTAPSGTVTFLDGTTVLSTRPLSAGAAVFTTTTLPGGQYTITARYSGDARWSSSASLPLALEVRTPPVCVDPTTVPIESPFDVRQGVWESDSCLFVLDEQTVTLGSPLVVDRPGQPGGPTTIPAGTTVTSTLVHVDKLLDTTAIVPIVGSRLWPREIVGVITSTTRLNSTNTLLGAPGTTYPTTSNRGLEANDLLTIGPDGRTVDFAMSAANGVDHLRFLSVNTAPICAEDPVDIDEDAPTTITVTCDDPDGDPITYTVDSAVNGTASILGDQLTITSDPNFNGEGSVTLTADDGLGSTTFTLPVVYAPTNDAPTCQPATARVVRGGSVTFSLSCSDIDGDELSAGATDAPINGDVEVDGMSITYLHAGVSNAGDSLAIEVSDGVDVASPSVVVSVALPKGIITPGQPYAIADPARRHIGNRVFEVDGGGVMVVGVSFPTVGQQYGVSFMKLDENLRSDISFGVDGVLSQFLPIGFYPSNVVLDEDGGVLALGNDFSIIRYLEDGSLDTAFGVNGRSAAPTLPANFLFSATFEATRQPDGKFVAIGWAVQNNNYNHQFVAAVRYLADGSIDTAFATNGVALLEATWQSPFCSSNDPHTRLRPNQLTVQPDGKILIIGSHHWCGLTKVAAMRLLANGTWDPGFGINGLTSSVGGDRSGEGQSVWLVDGGGFIVAGTRIYGGPTGGGGVIHRFLDNGALDLTFGGGDGRIEVGAGLVSPHAVGRDANGGYYFAGNETSGSVSRLVVLRADADGDLDTTFGTGGRFVESVGSQNSYGAREVITLSSGAMGVVGYSGVSSNGDVAAFHRFDAPSGALFRR